MSDEAGGSGAGEVKRIRGRQPLWITLLAGAAVGFGTGAAWGRVWIGVGLGLILALSARRLFP